MSSLNWTLPEGIKGLIFDCDGTLVDTMALHFQAWTAVLRRHSLEFSEERFYAWAGLPTDRIIERLAAERGIAVDAQAIAAERDACFHSQPESEFRPVEPVVAIARRFRGQLPMAVATGSTLVSARASLQAIGILDWFDSVVSSQEVVHPKPAPDVFLLAAERIKIDPAHCVAFEDGDAGLTAARVAGMQVVDIRPMLVS